MGLLCLPASRWRPRFGFGLGLNLESTPSALLDVQLPAANLRKSQPPNRMSQFLITNHLCIYIYIYVCVCVSISISSVSTYLTYQFCSLENLEGSFITTGLVFSMARGYIMSMWVISDLTICQLTWL